MLLTEMFRLNLIDDYQSNNTPIQMLKSIKSDNIRFILADEYSAIALNSDVVYASNNLASYQNIVIVYIEDEFTKAQDDYALITEDGFVISLEDFENQDEIAIVVRVK